MNAEKTIELKPIGIVRTEACENEVKNKSHISRIVLRKDLAESLEGIKDFSHIFVIFWMHKVSSRKRETIRVHPRGRCDLPLVGIFSTRTPTRPNPIGLTLAELVEVRANIISVRGLDAFDGTPVIDIKPFDNWDTSQKTRVPSWWKKMQKERTKSE